MPDTAAEWRKGNPARAKELARLGSIRFRTKQRVKVLRHYGSECACCGERDFHFLTIDHINGHIPESHYDPKGKRLFGDALITQIIREDFPDTVRVLCWNCNLAHSSFGFCPHDPPDDALFRYEANGDPIVPDLSFRERAKKTECIHGHSLDDAYIYSGVRVCRECIRQRNATRTKENDWTVQRRAERS